MSALVLALGAGAIAGLLAFRWALRAAPLLVGAARVLTPLGFALFGFLPAVAIRAGLLPQTGTTVLGALVYFLVFGVITNVILNGAMARASPNPSLERSRER